MAIESARRYFVVSTITPAAIAATEPVAEDLEVGPFMFGEVHGVG